MRTIFLYYCSSLYRDHFFTKKESKARKAKNEALASQITSFVQPRFEDKQLGTSVGITSGAAYGERSQLEPRFREKILGISIGFVFGVVTKVVVVVVDLGQAADV